MNTQTETYTVARLDRWLDTMRGSDGYTGPVAHWWQNCLQFAGAGLDWRYEGIIIGYLEILRRTGEEIWLDKARRAGDDLLRGQLETGNFRNSSFELNPYTGGTPHEAACDLALLSLASTLRNRGDAAWPSYADAPERNLRAYWLDRLWDPQTRSFRDSPEIASFVPNKASTLSEALLLLARLRDDEQFATTYALPTLDAVLAHQVHGSRLDGAIYQNSFGPRFVAKFFPYYIARCVPGLLDGYDWSGDERYLDGARRAMAFVMRTQYPDGSFPQVVYPDWKVNRYPQWVAAVGDILRALDRLNSYGVVYDHQQALAWMLSGQQPSGGFATGYGFAVQTSQRQPDRIAEFRDLLPVCGWSDKAFRYLASHIPEGQPLPEMKIADYETICVLRERPGIWRETAESLQLQVATRTVYHWQKGHAWASVAAQEAIWK